MHKFLVSIYLVLLAACQASPTPVPTHTPASTSTVLPIQSTSTSKPTLTSTVEPTVTPIPPTETPAPTLESFEFEMPAAFAPFENQFPLVTTNQTDVYLLRCAFDSAEIVYDLIVIEPFEIRSWVRCYFRTPDGRIDYVNFPWEVVNMGDRTWYMSTAIEQGGELPNPRACRPEVEYQCGNSVVALEKALPLHISVLSGTDKPKIYVIGLGFGYPRDNADLSQNFMYPLIEKTTNADVLDEFARTGNASVLPTYGDVEHFLPSFDYFYDVFR